MTWYVLDMGHVSKTAAYSGIGAAHNSRKHQTFYLNVKQSIVHNTEYDKEQHYIHDSPRLLPETRLTPFV